VRLQIRAIEARRLAGDNILLSHGCGPSGAPAAKYRQALAGHASHATVRLFASRREADRFLSGLSR